MTWPACTQDLVRSATSAVQGWTTARKWVSSWRRYNTRGRKRGAEPPPSPAENNQVFKSRRFGQIRENGVPRSSDSPVPAQATTVVNEPGFHPSSPAVLQRLVSVIVAIGPHSSFADEVSDCSELTMQLLQRRFQHFSDDWLRRVMCALRNWQVWAAKQSPPFPRWNPSANQLGEYLIDPDKRDPTVARGIWTQLDWVRREMGGAFPTDSSLLESFRLHAVGHLPTPADEMPPGVFLAIMHYSSKAQGAVAMFGGLVVLLAVACLRWRHQARSVVKHLNERFITGKCLSGQVQSARPKEELLRGGCPREIGWCFSILDVVDALRQEP